MKKVFSDIMQHTMNEPGFTPAHRDQWRALHAFHLQHPTSDSLPLLPITISAPRDAAETDQSWTMNHGMPVVWDSMWSKLAWRFNRPHACSMPFLDAEDALRTSCRELQ